MRPPLVNSVLVPRITAGIANDRAASPVVSHVALVGGPSSWQAQHALSWAWPRGGPHGQHCPIGSAFPVAVIATSDVMAAHAPLSNVMDAVPEPPSAAAGATIAAPITDPTTRPTHIVARMTHPFDPFKIDIKQSALESGLVYPLR
ncbi:MAG: hypothetical protein U0R27_04860 [Candidatus Nanopelagicales bacterium]|nr:MAG: hypothetical protein E6Q90_10885 [Actinomycetota bacterium]